MNRITPVFYFPETIRLDSLNNLKEDNKQRSKSTIMTCVEHSLILIIVFKRFTFLFARPEFTIASSQGKQ